MIDQRINVRTKIRGASILADPQNNAYEGVLHLQTNSKLMFYKETGDKREIIK